MPSTSNWGSQSLIARAGKKDGEVVQQMELVIRRYELEPDYRTPMAFSIS